MPLGTNFGDMLAHLQAEPGINTAFRQGWNGKNQYICLQMPDENSKMNMPYIFMTIKQALDNGGREPEDIRIPWLASQADMLTADWVLTRID